MQMQSPILITLEFVHHPVNLHAPGADPVDDGADQTAVVAHVAFVIREIVGPQCQGPVNPRQPQVLHDRTPGQQGHGKVTRRQHDLVDRLAVGSGPKRCHSNGSQWTPAAGMIVPFQLCALGA